MVSCRCQNPRGCAVAGKCLKKIKLFPDPPPSAPPAPTPADVEVWVYVATLGWVLVAILLLID